MAQRRIKPVSENMEKYQTYTEQIKRYNSAMKGEFYFEALLIDYAMLEDRLRSFMYHMGLLDNRTCVKVGKNKAVIKPIIEQFKNDDEKSSVGITNISGKLKIVRCVIKWASQTQEDFGGNNYLKVLKKQCESLDTEYLLDILNQIEDWKEYRNELIHCLFNKKVDSVYEQLQQKAEQGMIYARAMDQQLRLLKKGNVIRKAGNLKIEK